MPPGARQWSLLVTDDFSTETQYATFIGITLIICTRCPACHKRQSSFFACDSTLSTLQNDPLHSTSPDSPIFHQIEIIQPNVHHRHHVRVVVELIRSHNEPFLRNLVEKWQMAQTALRVYRQEHGYRYANRHRWCANGCFTVNLRQMVITTSGFSETRNCPPTGKPA